MTGTNATATWQYIDEVLYNPSVASTPFKMGQTAAAIGSCYYSDIECIKLNSDNENDFASPRGYIANGEGWNESVTPTTGGFLENTGWIVDTGSLEVTDEGDGTKSLELGLATEAHRPNPITSGYGTWEFELWKDLETSQPYISFLQDRVASFANALGYQIVVASTETVILRRTTAGGATTVLTTAAGYMPLQQWVKFKITRTTNGTWRMWIDDVEVGTATVDNTYTTGLPYININSSNPVGDKVRNFKFIPYIQ